MIYTCKFLKKKSLRDSDNSDTATCKKNRESVPRGCCADVTRRLGVKDPDKTPIKPRQDLEYSLGLFRIALEVISILRLPHGGRFCVLFFQIFAYVKKKYYLCRRFRATGKMLEICVDDDMSRMTAEEQRREEALRYKHVSGQYCCLRSWEMLRHRLIDNMQLSQSEADERMQEWQYNEHGKPHLKNGPYFSISHCKEAIAVAISDKPIGIDVESIRPAKEELIARVMSEGERRELSELNGEQKDRMFTRLWTRKEAIVKVQGTGILSFEQLQGILSRETIDINVQTFEKEKYIYSIAYGKLHCFGA